MRMRALVAVALLSPLPARNALAVSGNAPGNLALTITAGEQPDFIDEWVSTSYKNAVRVPRIHELRRGKTAHVAFLLTGLDRDSVSGATSSASYTIVARK